ncbi:transposase [Methyloglobulus sp.]|uniref:IS66 family transposase n=1 Tax=Methyloglobulus sp. TaxID=2518622 RepID=UPI0032B7A96D
MRKIIATVDKYGLKKYFLKKHIADVEQFYRTISKHKFETASAKKAQTRFKKNRNSLFTFLEFDGVPWNNNNAEHAVKAFGRGIHDIVDGRTSENGINEYLVLLSINQTCEYRGIDWKTASPTPKPSGCFGIGLRPCLGMVEVLFARFHQQLAKQGYIAQAGQIVDATFVEASRQRNGREENAQIKADEAPSAWDEAYPKSKKPCAARKTLTHAVQRRTLRGVNLFSVS